MSLRLLKLFSTTEDCIVDNLQSGHQIYVHDIQYSSKLELQVLPNINTFFKFNVPLKCFQYSLNAYLLLGSTSIYLIL